MKSLHVTRLNSVLAGLLFAGLALAQEPVDNCASLLGSISVELRYARTLAPSTRTTFLCPRDTSALLGANKQRILNSLGPPDAQTSGTPATWSYFFAPEPDGNYPAGVPVLRFEFDAGQRVGAVACERTR
jgi:hypothetical protein